MSPACKHSIPSGNSRSSFHRETLKALVGKILDLRQSRFPGAGRVCEATTGVAVRRGANRKIISTEPPRFVPFASSERFHEFQGFSSRFRRTGRPSRESRPRHARRSARCRSNLDARVAAAALPALPIRRRHALGRCARLSPLPLRFLQAHIQYPDQDTPREVAQQGALADLRRHDDRTKEHPQKRCGV